jgi:hypothetical protein
MRHFVERCIFNKITVIDISITGISTVFLYLEL